MPHCDTCACDNPTALSTFNLRWIRLLPPLVKSVRDSLPPEVSNRINWDGRMGSFHFTGLKYGMSNNFLAGQFMVALFPVPYADWERDTSSEPQFFAVNSLSPVSMGLTRYPVTSPMLPKPFQYNRGDSFDITNSLCREDLDEIGKWSDGQLAGYIGIHLKVLRDLVVEASLAAETAAS